MPNRQAIQIALEVARRAEKAIGGSVGYAEGGEVSDAKMAKAISDRAMRGLEPTPEQKKYLEHMREFGRKVDAPKDWWGDAVVPALPTVGKEIVRGLSPPIPGWSAQSFDEWSAQNKEKQDERRGMGEGERLKSSLSDFASEGIPYALPEIGAAAKPLIRPLLKPAGMAAAGLGALAMPGNAGAGKEEVAARQKMLKDAGFYSGEIDGEEGPATKAAQAKYDASAAARDAREVEKLKAQAALKAAEAAGKETERKSTEGDLVEAKRKKGEERFQQAEKDLDPFNRTLRDWGPTAGYAAGTLLGLLGKGAVNRASNKMSGAAATRANELLNKEATDLPARAANVNQFWSEGQNVPFFGSRTAPFEADPGKIPAFKSNPDAVPATDLYLPSRTKNAAVDLGAAGAFGAESLYAQEVMAPHAQKELEAARTAFKDDPSESNLARLQAALNQSATAEALTNLGRAGGISYLAGGIKMHRNPTRPDISKAEAERTRIDELLSGRGASGANPAPTGSPPQTPPSTPSGSAATPPSLGSLQAPVATPIPSGPAATALAGKGPSSEAGGVASSTPEVVFVPMVQSPSGTLHYPSREMLPEALRDQLRPGGWARNEHRPTKKEVARKKAASKSESKAESGQAPKISDPTDMADIPVKPDKLPDDPSLLTRGMNRGGAIGRAMQVVARAMGGRVHTGPVTEKADGGRTDTVPMHVAANSYVVPADIVSSLGQGDTNAGYGVLEQMFGPSQTRADGGAVPIIAAGGEYVLSPEQVAAIGKGDAKVGHEALDRFVVMQRRKHIQTLKGLPGPARD